jgi:hypothetical protein
LVGSFFAKQFVQALMILSEKVVKMMIVPKLAASTTANGCSPYQALNSTLYAMISSKSYVKMQLGGIQDFLAVPQYSIHQIN